MNDKLSEMRTQYRLPPASGHVCFAPCQPTDKAYCTAQESQTGHESGFCILDLADPLICGKQNAENILAENNSNEFNFLSTSDKLYSFRDNYLSKKNGGDKYIQLYYKLSEELDFSKMDFNLAQQTFVIIQKIIPKLDGIYDHPNSQTLVIIDDDLAENLINYLSSGKALAVNEESIEEINFIISKVSEFKNKNSNYITTHLK